MANEFSRNIKDAAKSVTKALPAAGANGNCDTLDLERVNGVPPEKILLEISVPATATLVNTKVLTFKLQDSADDSTYADVDPAISTTVTGTAGNVSAAKVVRIALPPNIRRYVQVNASAPADAGDNTATSVTYSLVF